MATPATPSRITCSAVSASEIDIYWSSSGANTTHYYLERSPDDATWAVIATLPATCTAYCNVGLVAGTLYYYRVRGYDMGSATYGNYSTPSASATTWTVGTVGRLLKWVTTTRHGDSNLAEAVTGGVGTFAATLTANRIWTFPDTAGTVALVGGAPTAHNLLSAAHGDTTPAACVLGDIVTGQAGPVWARLAISVPAANVRNVLGVDNAETVPTWKTALDANNPTTIGVGDAAAPGTSLVFAHRDHQHASPATWTPSAHDLLSASHGDTVASPVARGDLVVGVAGPSWDNLALGGAAGSLLTRDANDVAWSAFYLTGHATRTYHFPDYDMSLPAADAHGYLHSDGAGTLTWDAGGGGGAHDILSATHSDSAAAAVSQGSLIVGNATPAWSELVVGTANSILTNDGTDVAWSTYFITGTAGGTTDLAVTNTKTLTITSADTYNITVPKTGTLVVGTGTATRVAAWSDANTVAAGTIVQPAANVLTVTNAAAATLGLAITAGKTLTLTCADDYNLTIPATGTAVLGTGTSTYVTYWSGTNTVAGSANLTWDGTRLLAQIADAATATLVYPIRISHITSDTAATGFGTGVEFYLEDSAGNVQFAGSLGARWTVATHDTEVSRLEGWVQGIAVGLVMVLTGDDTGVSLEGNARGAGSIELQANRANATNVASGVYSTIVGGNSQTASGGDSTVVGGSSNSASGVLTTIVGGETNVISGARSAVVGGTECEVAGDYSFGGGLRSHIGAIHFGTFMWSDSEDADFTSVQQDEAAFRVSWIRNAYDNSYYSTWATASDGDVTFDIVHAAGTPTFTLTHSVIIGANDGVDYTLTFDGNSNDGVLTWMEDEDYFKFDDDILMLTAEAIYFRDTAISIRSSDDGHLDLAADVSIDLNTAADTDLVVNFAGTTHSGVLTWMEDEDYFKFGDAVVINGVTTVSLNAAALPAALTGTVLHISNADSTVTRLLIDAFAQTPNVTFRHAQGTAGGGGPTATQANNVMGSFGANGYGATGYSAASQVAVLFYAAENWTDAAQGTYMVFGTTATGSASRSERMRITAAGTVQPGANKTQDLGATGTRWNTLYIGTSTAAGTSRLVKSTRLCPVCKTEMVRGTGSLCILGETADYEVAQCPKCGILATEEMKHLPDAQKAKRRTPSQITFVGFHVFEMSGNSRKVRVDFDYGELKNSTYLGETELADLLTMTEKQRAAFLRTLGEREWYALEESRLMQETCAVLQSDLDTIGAQFAGKAL